MADQFDVPEEHRRHARSVPAEVREALTPAELRLRCAHAAELEDSAAETPFAEHSRYLYQRKRSVLRSKPALEFVERDRELNRMALEAPRTIEYGRDGRPYSMAGIYEAMRRDHRDGNSYPPGLLAALDDALLGKPVAHPELGPVVRAITGAHHAA